MADGYRGDVVGGVNEVEDRRLDRGSYQLMVVVMVTEELDAIVDNTHAVRVVKFAGVTG